MFHPKALPDICLVSQFHYDVAYHKNVGQYLVQSIPLIDQALDILQRSPDYRYLIEQVFLLEAWWKQASGEARRRMVEFAEQGRLEAAPGMYVMPDLNHPNGESLYRQIAAGRQWLADHLGFQPRVCLISDCWGHHAQLPQILSQCGYDYYVFWRCMRPDLQRNQFRWKGLDGTVLPVHWLAVGCGGVYFPPKDFDRTEPWYGSPPADAETLLSLTARIQENGPSSAVLIPCGGDFLAPEPTAPEQLRKLRQQFDSIQFATPVEFLRRIDWENQPIVDGEFNSAFQGSFTSNIRLKQLNRRLTHRLTSLEALAVVRNHRAEYDDLWRPLLKLQFHDIICGTICDSALREALEDYAGLEDRVEAAVQSLNGEKGIDALFNSLPFARTESLVIEGREHVVDLPPMGFAALAGARSAESVRVPSLPLTFETDDYRASVNGRGYVDSLIVKSTGLELVDSSIAFGSLAVQMDCGDLWLNFKAPLSGGSPCAALTHNDPDPYDPGDGELTWNKTQCMSVRGARVLEASADHLVVQQESKLAIFHAIRLECVTRMVFRRRSPLIHYQTRLKPSGRHYRLRVVFGTPLRDGIIRHEIPCGIQQRPPGEHVAQHWFDYGGDRGGLAVLNRGTPSGNVDDGCLLMTLFRSAAMDSKAPSDDSFNDGVEHLFDYALFPHAPGADAQIVRLGLSFNNPPMPCRCDAKRIDAPGMILGPDNVQLAACRWRGQRIFIRLYESIGRSAAVRLRPGFEAKTWSLADAFGEPLGPPRPVDHVIDLDLAPFQIQGLLINNY